MDGELKAKLDAIENKLDTAIAHQEEICRLKHKAIEDHLMSSQVFRDKVEKNSVWIIACWTIVCLMLGRVLWSALAGLIK